jgi:hypothetical protein
MIEIAEAINSFASVAQQTEVSPEEPIFVLTGCQLQEIISRAIQDAMEPLYQEIAYDRQRIAKLEQKEPQPLRKDRGELLRALLAVHGGRILAKDARRLMHLSKSRFSELLAICDFIETKPYHLDRRQDIIILKS